MSLLCRLSQPRLLPVERFVVVAGALSAIALLILKVLGA